LFINIFLPSTKAHLFHCHQLLCTSFFFPIVIQKVQGLSLIFFASNVFFFTLWVHALCCCYSQLVILSSFCKFFFWFSCCFQNIVGGISILNSISKV
jgi:hypothetical protein